MAYTYLYEEEQVRILALGGSPVALLDMVTVEVDTLSTAFSTHILSSISNALTILAGLDGACGVE
jgi:UDP-N-acetylmuramyl pentapeptide phosphotransferase/UDP-N-acetylglucosamine-1-phosphate transferase